ncbi:MAG: hypothetical protein DRJ50_13540 [Actinobacteria bacterium]|nr:MAG: hypothetical protein DRJ50_13540 [Actinomycetota bacterium]
MYNTLTLDSTSDNAFALGSSNLLRRFHWNNIEGAAGCSSDGKTGCDATLAVGVNQFGSAADMRHNHWSDATLPPYPGEYGKIYDIADRSDIARIDYRGAEQLPIDTNIQLETRFVSPSNEALLSVAGLTLYGTAYAEDGIDSVEISTDGGSNWTQVTDGPEAWSFGYTPPPGGATVTFLVQVTDSSAGTDTDQITLTFDPLEPTTEGEISTPTETWGHPSVPQTITLTGDVVVPEDTTLTIYPGTKIQAQPLADNLQGGVDPSRIELIVLGTLIMQGDGPGSIEFRSSSITPLAGHWYGIRYGDLALSMPALRDVSLLHGVTGLSRSSGFLPDLEGVEIAYMSIDGINSNAPGTGTWSLENVTVSFVGNHGLDIGGSTGATQFDLAQLDIREVGTRAIYAGLDSNDTVAIQDGMFAGTTNKSLVDMVGPGVFTLRQTDILQGLSTSDGALYVRSTTAVTIEDSEIRGGKKPVWLSGSGMTAAVRRNRITGGTTGLMIDGPYQTNHVILEGNHITGHSQNGVFLLSTATAVLRRNDLYDNGDESGQYSLYNDTPNPVDAGGNFWGVSAASEFAGACPLNDIDITTIYDQFEDPSKGLVTYCDPAQHEFGDQPTLYFDDNDGQREIQWNAKDGLTYDLIRGNLVNLSATGGHVDLADVTCDAASPDGSGVIVDISGDPAPGAAFFYLLRDHDTPGGYGFSSMGADRIPGSGDCPGGA